MNIAWIGMSSLLLASTYGCSQASTGPAGDSMGPPTGGTSIGGDRHGGGAASPPPKARETGAATSSGGDAAPASPSEAEAGVLITYWDASAPNSATSSGDGGQTSVAIGDAGQTSVTIVNSDGGSAVVDPDIAYSVTLTSDSFTVQPNTESFTCQDFANPFQGRQVDIKTYSNDMTSGSHHMSLYYRTGATNGSMVPCSGLETFPFTFVAQGPHVVQTYPEGVGATVPSTIGFHMNIHYINSGTTTFLAQVKVTMDIWKSGRVTNHAGMLFNNNLNLNVPSDGQPHTYTASCAVPQDVYVMSTDSHMHGEATKFAATAGGTTLYETTQWADPPQRVFSPPLHLASGTIISWECTYVNTTGMTLTFGETAGKNVMCISQSTFYPVQDISSPTIDCQTTGTSN
jgi:hypothetical protein